MIEAHSSCIRVSDIGKCPKCSSPHIIRNGHTKTGKQQFYCKNCEKRFIDFYSYRAYHSHINTYIVKLTKEGLGIRSTARILKISTTTLLHRLKEISDNIALPPVPCNKAYEVDEMCFFIGHKNNKMWLVYAIEKESRKVVNFHIGKRTNKSLNHIIQSLKDALPHCIYTDGLKNYTSLIPSKLHKVKRFGTNLIERKNLNIRTHLKRFNRRTICFTKSLKTLLCILKIYFFS